MKNMKLIFLIFGVLLSLNSSVGYAISEEDIKSLNMFENASSMDDLTKETVEKVMAVVERVSSLDVKPDKLFYKFCEGNGRTKDDCECRANKFKDKNNNISEYKTHYYSIKDEVKVLGFKSRMLSQMLLARKYGINPNSINRVNKQAMNNGGAMAKRCNISAHKLAGTITDGSYDGAWLYPLSSSSSKTVAVLYIKDGNIISTNITMPRLSRKQKKSGEAAELRWDNSVTKWEVVNVSKGVFDFELKSESKSRYLNLLPKKSLYTLDGKILQNGQEYVRFYDLDTATHQWKEFYEGDLGKVVVKSGIKSRNPEWTKYWVTRKEEISWGFKELTGIDISPKTKSKFGNDIDIIGDENYVKVIDRCLGLLGSKAPEVLKFVDQNIGVISRSSRSGMHAYENPPRFDFSLNEALHSDEWCAGAIVHDAYHSWLFKKNKLTKNECNTYHLWGGKEAELEAIRYQEKVLISLGASKELIEYARSLDGSHGGEHCG